MKQYSTIRSVLAQIFISPNSVRLRVAWRLAAHLGIFILTAIVISIPFIFAGFLFPEIDTMVQASMIGLASITLSVYVARRWVDKRSFTSLGLKWNNRAVKDILVGILISALMMASVFSIELLFGWIRFERFAWDSLSAQTIAYEFGIWSLIFIAVGWYEELLMRGYYLQNLIEGLNIPWALFLSSLIFSSLHLANPEVTILSVLGLLAAGYFLAFGYLRSKQLWLPIGLHIGWNLFEGPVFGFPVSGMQTFSLLVQFPNGPVQITGGNFGPEAGLIMMPAFLIGVILINRYTQDRNRS